MRLKDYQDQFRALMLDSPHTLQAPSKDLEGFFAKDDIALLERLNVYRNNVMGSLSAVIVKTFPLLCALVGEDFVRAMARQFISESPPSAGSLNLLGQGFDAFIEEFPPAKKIPYLPAMASIEIAVNEAYHARDDDPLTAESLGKVPPEALPDLAVRLRHSVCLIESEYPLMDIRAMCLNPDQAKPLDLEAGGVKLMIHRPVFTVIYTEINDDEWALFKNLQAGYTLGQAVERTLEAFPALDFQEFLQKFLQAETFQALSTNKG